MSTRGDPVCDKDCSNCKFPECVYDGMEHEDYVQSRERDKLLAQTPEGKKVAAQKRAYYEANREKAVERK